MKAGMHGVYGVYGVFAQVSGSPDTSQLPGGQVLQDLTDGVMGFALVACLIALFISAGAWALGANSQNYQYTSAGKRGVLVSGLAALLVGCRAGDHQLLLHRRRRHLMPPPHPLDARPRWRGGARLHAAVAAVVTGGMLLAVGGTGGGGGADPHPHPDLGCDARTGRLADAHPGTDSRGRVGGAVPGRATPPAPPPPTGGGGGFGGGLIGWGADAAVDAVVVGSSWTAPGGCSPG